MKNLSRHELYEMFEDYQHKQKLKKDGTPMFSRYGAPVMVTHEPKIVPQKTQELIDKLISSDGVDGLILYVNPNMSKGQFGYKSTVAFGPGCNIKKLEDAPKHMHNRRQYLYAVYRKHHD